VGGFGRFGRQGFAVEGLGGVGIQRQCELVVPAKLEPRLRQCVVTVLSAGMFLCQIGGMRGYLVDSPDLSMGPPPGYFSTTDSCYLTESADLHFICGASVTVLIGYQDVVYSRRPEAAIARARRHIPNVGAQFVLGANDTQTLDRPSSSTTRKPEMPRG
jgi:hypothetical protein